MADLIPKQQVLYDGTVYVTYVGPVPGEPHKAIVEAYGSGSMVVDRSRLQPIA